MKLQYTSTGSGRNVVFLHGWGVNSGVWSGVVGKLSEAYTVTCIDLPGFGQNYNQVPEPYNLDNLAESIASNLPLNCVLVGWSLGGLVAQKLALNYPDKIEQLVLICSSPKFSQQGDWPGIDEKVLSMFSQQLERDFSKTLERFLAIQAMGSKTARKDVKQIKQAIEQYHAPSAKALAQGLNLLNDCDLREELFKLRVPCHAFFGKQDSLVPAKIAKEMASYSSGISTHIFADASHAPFISNLDEFIKALREVLA